MIPGRPTCVSWLLLASYAVLLGVGGVGVWVSVNNFWKDESLPTPPPDLTANVTTTTTTTPNPYGYNNDYRREKEVPEAYKEYIYANNFYARVSSDSRLYVVVPCAVCMVMAALVLVGGLWTRQFFSYTFSLYSSLSMWALTLTWAIIYQNVVAWNSRMNLDFVCWVLAFQIVLMLLLSVQILLCVWELRRQNAGWPTINVRNIFTVEAILVTARLTLTVFTFSVMAWSQMMRGYDTEKDPRFESFWGTPRERFPLAVIFVCLSAICFSAVATMETTLSMMFGKLHKNMTTVTCILSTLCCIAVAVLNSPVVLKVMSNTDRIYPETMYFTIGLSVVLFLHVVASLVFPIGSRSPPGIISKICDFMGSFMSSLRNGSVDEQLLNSSLLQRKGKGFLVVNMISAIFTTLSIIIAGSVWDSPMYRAWGTVLVLCSNSATLVRTLPAFVMEFMCKEPDNATLNQRLMAMSLESFGLLVGASAMCAESWGGGEIFVGVMNLLFFVFQIYIMVPLVKEKVRPQTQSNEAESDAETEVPSEGNDEQNPIVTLP